MIRVSQKVCEEKQGREAVLGTSRRPSQIGWSWAVSTGETGGQRRRWPSKKRDSKFPKTEPLLHAVSRDGIAQSFWDGVTYDSRHDLGKGVMHIELCQPNHYYEVKSLNPQTLC